MINSNNILDQVKVKFPEFITSEEMDGLPTVVFAFLSNYLIESIRNKNSEVIKRFTTFVNELSLSDDKTVIACLSEIHLGLYDTSKINYKEFMDTLSSPAQDSFQKSINLWNSQFGRSQGSKS